MFHLTFGFSFSISQKIFCLFSAHTQQTLNLSSVKNNRRFETRDNKQKVFGSFSPRIRPKYAMAPKIKGKMGRGCCHFSPSFKTELPVKSSFFTPQKNPLDSLLNQSRMVPLKSTALFHFKGHLDGKRNCMNLFATFHIHAPLDLGK